MFIATLMAGLASLVLRGIRAWVAVTRWAPRRMRGLGLRQVWVRGQVLVGPVAAVVRHAPGGRSGKVLRCRGQAIGGQTARSRLLLEGNGVVEWKQLRPLRQEVVPPLKRHRGGCEGKRHVDRMRVQVRRRVERRRDCKPRAGGCERKRRSGRWKAQELERLERRRQCKRQTGGVCARRRRWNRWRGQGLMVR